MAETKKKIQSGDRVRLTHPAYPEVQYEGYFETADLTGEPTEGVMGTYSLRLPSGQKARSEGVLELVEYDLSADPPQLVTDAKIEQQEIEE